MNGPAIALSQLDSDRFGIRVARCEVTTRKDLQEAVDQCDADSVRLLIVRTTTDSLDCVTALQQKQALLTDTLLGFRLDLKGSTLSGDRHAHDSLQIRLGTAVDAVVVRNLASEIFAGYPNHYRNDPRLDAGVVAQIYPSWAERVTSQQLASEPVMIGSAQGVELALGVMKSSDRDLTMDVALFGVVPAAAGKRVGATFLSTMLAHARDSGMHAATYYTQVTNLAAQRMVVRAGFLPHGSQYTFHYWMP